MTDSPIAERVAAVRHFNRFYTRQIGLLNEGLLRTEWSLTEVRVLYELAHRDKPTATALGKELGVDPGYLSRILRDFEKRGLITRRPSAEDGRQALLSLTKRGRSTFADLDARSSKEIAAILERLTAGEQHQLIDAAHTIEGLLGARSKPTDPAPYVLRPHRPGDMGWVVHRHGVLYAQEYGWDERFEALVAKIAAKFVKHFDSKRERCWIAEQGGSVVGSVFLVKRSKAVAKLRLLLVEPSARGQGIGARLVDECVRFARQAGYRKIILWTQQDLLAARHIYAAAGFQLAGEKKHHSFGHDLTAETWELAL